MNGGQANLAASTTDFGERALVADGKSTTAIFTSNVDGAANSGAISFNVNEPTTGTGWFGDTNRPASNMLVTVNSVTYPILSAVANTDSEGGNGWTVTISRPDPNNRSVNLGLNGAVADNLAVEFFLRSQIASSGHTMEYVGSGMDYRALPENGGVPDETKQITELNDGKIWTAITDHNGKFKIGGNQTDDPFFEVDQQLGFVTIPEGSIAFNLLSDLTPQLGGNLDVNGNNIVSTSNNDITINPNGTGKINLVGNITNTTLNANIVLEPNGTGSVDVNTSKIINVTDPTADQDAATKKYVDDTVAGIDEVVEDTTPQLGGDLDSNGHDIKFADDDKALFGTGDDLKIYHDSNNSYIADTGTGNLFIRANSQVVLESNNGENYIECNENGAVNLYHNGGVRISTVSDGANVAGSLTVNGTGSITVPQGTTAERPGTGVNGMFRYNTTDNRFEGYLNNAWGAVGGGATGGGSDGWALEHDNTITASYTIGTGKNVISAGPLTVNSGATVTVPSGSTWTIV